MSNKNCRMSCVVLVLQMTQTGPLKWIWCLSASWKQHFYFHKIVLSSSSGSITMVLYFHSVSFRAVQTWHSLSWDRSLQFAAFSDDFYRGNSAIVFGFLADFQLIARQMTNSSPEKKYLEVFLPLPPLI